jgi:hypothetical protein
MKSRKSSISVGPPTIERDENERIQTTDSLLTEWQNRILCCLGVAHHVFNKIAELVIVQDGYSRNEIERWKRIFAI